MRHDAGLGNQPKEFKNNKEESGNFLTKHYKNDKDEASNFMIK